MITTGRMMLGYGVMISLLLLLLQCSAHYTNESHVHEHDNMRPSADFYANMMDMEDSDDNYYHGKGDKRESTHEMASWGEFRIRQMKKTGCEFHGYTPIKETDLGKIKPPKIVIEGKQEILTLLVPMAKERSQTLTSIKEALEKDSNKEIIQKVSEKFKFLKHLGKVAEKVGPALGYLGIALSLFSGAASALGYGPPTTDDIIKSMDKAIEELTKDVEKKFDKMQDYVDAGIIKAVRDMNDNQYKSYLERWKRCLNEKKPLDCQVRLNTDTIGAWQTFMPYWDKLQRYTESTFFNYRKTDYFKKVMQLEASLVNFRNYVNLVLNQLIPLMQHYCGIAQLTLRECKDIQGPDRCRDRKYGGRCGRNSNEDENCEKSCGICTTGLPMISSNNMFSIQKFMFNFHQKKVGARGLAAEGKYILKGTLNTQQKSISFDIKFSDSSKDVTFTGRYFSGAHKIQSINGQWRTTANKPPILMVFEVDTKCVERKTKCNPGEQCFKGACVCIPGYRRGPGPNGRCKDDCGGKTCKFTEECQNKKCQCQVGYNRESAGSACKATSSQVHQKQTTGSCDIMLSEAECRAAAKDVGKTFDYATGSGYVPGCYVSRGKVYYNKALFSNKLCSSGMECLCARSYQRREVGVCGKSLTDGQCRQYASVAGLSFNQEVSSSYPQGCVQRVQYGRKSVVYNKGNGKDVRCTFTTSCICSKYHDAENVYHKQLYRTSGNCQYNLLSEGQCKKIASKMGASFKNSIRSIDYPPGCYVNKQGVYFNFHSHSNGQCSSERKCICSLTRTAVYDRWRSDNRCGPQYPDSNGLAAICRPDLKCCNMQWGYCDNTKRHCDCNHDCINYHSSSGDQPLYSPMEVSDVPHYNEVKRADSEYQTEDQKSCKRYTGRIIEFVDKFIKYAQNAVQAIKDGHNGGPDKSGRCMGTVKCTGQKLIWSGFWKNVHEDNERSCWCYVEKSARCEVKLRVQINKWNPDRKKYSVHHYSGIKTFDRAGQRWGRDTLKRYTQAYQRKNHQVMEKYWKVELLDMIPTWRAAKVAAQEMQKYSKSSYGDDFDEE